MAWAALPEAVPEAWPVADRPQRLFGSGEPFAHFLQLLREILA